MIVDLFAGPGGWSEGLRLLGLGDVGIERDVAACSTRAAAGHRTVRADVATYPAARFAGAEGVIASPPCTDWSIAGKGARRTGESGHLVDVVPRWVDAVRPRWVACEQVPPALDVWHEHASLYRSWGYSTWAGVLNAADYGVPQTRRRAILIARRDGPAAPPAPTHCRGGASTMFGSLAPWVSMAEALGWADDVELHHIRGAGMTERHGDRPGRPASEPAFSIEGGCWRRMVIRTNQDSLIRKGVTKRYERDVDRPSPTLTGLARIWAWDRPATTLTTDQRMFGPHAGSAGESQSENAIKLTLAEALTLQSFTADYPVQGTKTKQFEQVGNAVPPLLAAHVIAAVTGRALDLDAAPVLEEAS